MTPLSRHRMRPAAGGSPVSALFPQDDPGPFAGTLREFLPGHPLQSRTVGVPAPGLPSLHKASKQSLFPVLHLVDREEPKHPGVLPRGFPPRRRLGRKNSNIDALKKNIISFSHLLIRLLRAGKPFSHVSPWNPGC